MAITDKINEIIDRRIGRNGFEGKGHLEVIKKKKGFFEELGSLMDEYSTLRETILSQIKEQKGEYYVMSVEDPTFQDKVELADPSAFMLQLQKCQAECERLEKRFNRDTINISVVGRAGQGKSRLLQSISGVENDIIPADTGGDCTGAKSTIANAPGQMHAKIKFYTEQEIVSQINGYLEKIGASSHMIGSVSQISHIPVNSIQVTTTTQESLLEHLKKYVELTLDRRLMRPISLGSVITLPNTPQAIPTNIIMPISELRKLRFTLLSQPLMLGESCWLIPLGLVTPQ